MNRGGKDWLRLAALAGALGLLVIGFGATTPGFLDPVNLADRSRSWVEPGLMGIPMTFIIASAGIDLSIGSLLALAGVVAGSLHLAGWPLGAALAGAILTGLLGGCFNAFLMQALQLPALVVTLATLALFRGLAFGISGARPVSGWPDAFTDWGSVTVLPLAGAVGVPWTVVLLLGAVAFGTLLFNNHLLGRRSRQIGENPIAARFSGISENGVRYLIYGMSGLACGLAAVCWTARFATAHPGAAQGMELDVIAVVVIGGARITGGTGSVPGTFLGVLLLGLLRYGLDLRGVTQQDQAILIGLLVVAIAVANAKTASLSQH